MVKIPAKGEMLANLRAYLDAGKGRLWKNQREVLEATHRFLSLRKGSNIHTDETEFPDFDDATNKKQGDYFEVVSATATGKTRTFGALPQATRARTLIITPRILLNQQTRDKLVEGIGIPAEQIGIYDSNQSQRKRTAAIIKPILVVSYLGLGSLFEKELISGNPEHPAYRPLVILDEVHEQAQGYVTSQHIEKFRDHCVIAGFTATDAGAYNTLFNGQIPIYHLDLPEAIEGGLIVGRAKGIVVDVLTDAKWLKQYKLKHGEDYSEEMIDKIIRSPAMMKAAIHMHFQYEDEHVGPIARLPAVFYVHRVDAAQHGAALFNRYAARIGSSVRAEAISGDMYPDEQSEILARFKAGKIQAVWNDKFIGLGFDDSNLTVVHGMKPSRFSDKPAQQFGRSTRREGDDYALRFGQHKTALGITYRMPGMYPVTFNDVLGGVPQVYDSKHDPGNYWGGEQAPAVKIPGIRIHASEAELIEVIDQNKRRRERQKGVVPENWMTIKEAVALSGLSSGQIRWRLRKIDPEGVYNKLGLPPSNADEKTVPGSELVRRMDNGRVIIRTPLVEAWALIQRERDKKLEEGYTTVKKLIEETGATSEVLRARLKVFRERNDPRDMGHTK